MFVLATLNYAIKKFLFTYLFFVENSYQFGEDVRNVV